MKLIIDNKIRIVNASPQVAASIKQDLTFVNPDYIKKERMGKWTGGIQKNIYLYENDGSDIVIPYGYLFKLKQRFTEIDKLIPQYDKIELKIPKISLYDYQKKAVLKMLDSTYGILQAPAGSGKTRCGITLACSLRFKTLWLTNKIDLLNQARDTALSLGVPKNKIGTITAGKVNIGEFITFATVQTMSNLDISLYKNTFGCVIVDECHRVAGTPTSVTQFSKILNHLACYHKYGLSATPKRADGLIACTKALIGDVVHIVPKSEVADNIIDPVVQVINLQTKMKDEWLDTDGTISWSKLVNGLCDDADRTDAIAKNIAAQGGYNYQIVLSDRVHHLEALRERIRYYSNDALLGYIVDGKTKKSLREFAINEMRAGRGKVLLATYALAKEGLDIVNLDRLHFATCQTDPTTIEQSLGRISRVDKLNPYKKPICFDYVDVNIGILARKYKKRVTTYNKLDLKIISTK